MELSQRKEQISVAYIHALASAAGFKIYDMEVDDESVDLGLASSGVHGTTRSPRLEMQLKCTESDVSIVKSGGVDAFSFQIKLKNYDDLRQTDYLVPKIVALLMVPRSTDEWVTCDKEKSILRRAAYWTSLRGEPAFTGKGEKVTVHFPCSQMLSPAALTDLMNRVGGGSL